MTDAQPQQLAATCAQALLSRDRASRKLGIQLLEVGPGSARLSMMVTVDHLQGYGTCHGGLIFTLADAAFAVACNTYDEATVASGCSIDFLNPAHVGDDLVAQAVEQSRRGRTGLYDVRIENQRGELIALFRGKAYKVHGPVLAQEKLDD
ncbi:hydroxyphenylacetyl-CoA thioesterase PaaI [Pseudomonas oryzihabitans]|uniref:Phenylacetic acid degradation protein PaaD n=1 Tax=Pseudomonas oryzihabitans TaxID=47885 RepID=A0ABX3IT87_9PSED|nr:hydroxyphenylacetyl-CoA thioesterase PaaI [Pseudomonas psychrotolerans]ONN71069.1 phenylacetic acid degradation protein PaaD [Pseudomonas psychrotolerans]